MKRASIQARSNLLEPLDDNALPLPPSHGSHHHRSRYPPPPPPRHGTTSTFVVCALSPPHPIQKAKSKSGSHAAAVLLTTARQSTTQPFDSAPSMHSHQPPPSRKPLLPPLAFTASAARGPCWPVRRSTGRPMDHENTRRNHVNRRHRRTALLLRALPLHPEIAKRYSKPNFTYLKARRGEAAQQ